MRKHQNTRGLSISGKLTLALGAIAAVMIVTIVISALEYRKISSYVSDLINADIECINTAQDIAMKAEKYNLQILSAVGTADSVVVVSNFDMDASLAECEEALARLDNVHGMPLSDSLGTSLKAYLEASKELRTVIASDFRYAGGWFFEVLQPKFNAFTAVLAAYNEDVHTDLADKAEDFEIGFYRSIIPSVVAVGTGLLLIFLLMFFVNVYYVRPIYRMLDSLEDYVKFGRAYTYTFEGDDQLQALSGGISDVVSENIDLRRRVKRLKGQETPEEVKTEE